MEKDVEVVVAKGSGKAPKVKQGRKQDNPLRSAGAQKLLEDDVYRTPDIVKSTTSALIDEGFLPSQQHLDEGFLSAEAYECLARLDKKDSATKLKALSDYLQILSTKNSSEVVNTRTFWARFYISFLEDEDPRVRELASRCHQQFVTVLKKDIVPVLGRIIGPWWLSQFQMHASAAVASRLAFQSAFTEHKRPEVLRRYAKDILTLLRNRILPKSSLADKAKGKGQDVSSLSDDQQGRVAEGLDALNGFVHDLNSEGVEEVYPSVKDSLLDKPEFWKLVRLQSPKVRQSFFRLMSMLWNRNEGGMKSYTLQTLTAVIGSLHDKDVRTASEVWELLLLVITKEPQWSTIVNVDKTLLPKLVILLKNGGFGCAKIVFPSLIVLIDKLPNKKPEIYDSLVSALVQGFSAEEVRAADIPVICQALSDCFRYCVKKEEEAVSFRLAEKNLLPLYVDVFFGSGNMIKGWDVINAMLLSWTGREGKEQHFASESFGRLAEKLAYTSAEEVNVERTKQWWAKLTEGAARLKDASLKMDGDILDKFIATNKPFQDVVFQLFRLALRLVQSSDEEPNVQLLKTLLVDVRSDIVYGRLKKHLEDEESSELSAQRLVFESLPTLLDGSETKLDTFSRLMCDCHSPGDVQQLFNVAWQTFPDRLRLLKQLKKDGGLTLVRSVMGEAQMANLLGLAESLLKNKSRQAMEDSQSLLTLLAQLQPKEGPTSTQSTNLISQFLTKAHKLDLVARLRLYGSVMSAGIEVPSLLPSIVTTLVDLAADQKTDETDVADVSRIFLPMADRLSGQWNTPEVVQRIRQGLGSRDGQEFLTRFVQIAKSLSASEGVVKREFVQLALSIADFGALADKVLRRTDIFAGALTMLDMGQDVKLQHAFWDDEMEQAAVSCCFVISLLDNQLLQTDFRKESTAFTRCLLPVAAHNQLALTSPPLVYDEQIRLQAEAYRQKFQPALTEEIYSLLTEAYPNEKWVSSFWAMVGRSRFDVASVEKLEPLELAVHYAHMSRENKSSDYGAALRDRLEDMLTTTELPTTIETMSQTSWSQVQLLRLIPTLLKDRCLDLSYSGPVLDKFGSVVIDWLACLQSPNFSPDNVKVLVLIQEALGGVADIVKNAETLKDSGMLWLELTEFSFPRILASLLDGLFRFAEESDNYLTQRHPLVARVIASVCGLVQLFATDAQGLLRIVWETMFKLEIGLPDRLSTLQSRPVDMVLAVIRLFAPLLLHRVAHFQLVAADVLTNLIPFFPPTYRTENVMAVIEIGQNKDRASKDPSGTPSDKPKDKEKEQQVEPLAPPVELLSLLQESGEIVETMLDDVPLGEAFGSVVPQTDSYTYMLGYLMTWKAILAWISNESNEAKQAFAKYLETSTVYSQLLDNMTRLLPLPSDEEAAHHISLAMFVPALNDMQTLAPDVYAAALQQMPMLARAWFSRKQGSVARDVDKYTTRHVTPQLVRKELAAADIQARHVMFDNFKVSVRPTVAEITAEYRVEVWIAEIVIRIPKDYPLSSAAVSWGRTKGSASDAWDQWVIRLRGFLQRQNGSIMDGLLAWKSSVDKKFRDIQACAICLSIVEVKSAALPQMQCKTCKNKFHNACLYRWFEQQVDPTCPLCREKFF